jgi:hypothetical protein
MQLADFSAKLYQDWMEFQFLHVPKDTSIKNLLITSKGCSSCQSFAISLVYRAAGVEKSQNIGKAHLFIQTKLPDVRYMSAIGQVSSSINKNLFL